MRNDLIESYKELRKEGPLIALCETFTGRLIKIITSKNSSGKKMLEFTFDDGRSIKYNKSSFKSVIQEYNGNVNNPDKIKVACRYGTILYFNRGGEQIPDPDNIFIPNSIEDMELHLSFLGHSVIDGWELKSVNSIVATGGDEVFAVIDCDENKYFVSILKDGTVYKKHPYDSSKVMVEMSC